jgi:hypothetical protein
MEWAIPGAVGVLTGTLIGSLLRKDSPRQIVLRVVLSGIGVGIAVVIVALVTAMIDVNGTARMGTDRPASSSAAKLAGLTGLPDRRRSVPATHLLAGDVVVVDAHRPA